MSWSQFLYEAAVWPFLREQRNVLAWILSAVLTIYLLHTSLREGVNGHDTCDFAGQWMHGRAFYRMEMSGLYTVESGKGWLAEGYEGKEHDRQVNDVLKKGSRTELFDEGIAGPLYPPTATIPFSVFAQFKPAVAHAVVVCVYLALCYACGWFISQSTNRRIQWSEATLLTLFFPNNFMGLMLGQNQVLTLFILTAGWYCHARRLPFLAGLVWGLFAYKPVFAVALLLIPVVYRSPRWFLGMAISGMLFVAATLPYGGIEPWLRWLRVGKHAEEIYQIDRNWVWMSRDLVGLPRRKMWDTQSFLDVMRHNVGVFQPGAVWTVSGTDGNVYTRPQFWLFWGEDFNWEKHQLVYFEFDKQGAPVTFIHLTIIGYALLITVALGTVLVGWRVIPPYEQASNAMVFGPPAIFVLTGSLLCVFHFMHYDLVSFALPVLLAVAQWKDGPRVRQVFMLAWYMFWLFRTYSFFFGNAILEAPWETYLLLLLWLWMGWCAWADTSVTRGVSRSKPMHPVQPASPTYPPAN
ncbi:MAG TPA: glycosyltransferase family 87 protein [Gemmatales bacterium]|nr:glycosyltransferase family 87 protein [Gemmatales bacterium]